MSRKNHQRPCTKAATASIPWAKQSWQPQCVKDAYVVRNSIRRARQRKEGLRMFSAFALLDHLDRWAVAQKHRVYVSYELGEGRRRFGSTRANIAALRHLRHFTKLAATVLPR